MSEMRKATMAEAKAAWDAYPEQDRSIRLVIKALKEKNLTCTISSMQRWTASKWTLKKQRFIKDPQSIHEATVKVIEHIAGHQEASAKLTAEIKSERERVLQDNPDDAQLSRLAAREKMAAQVALARCIADNAAAIVAEKPGAVIGLLEVLNVPIAPIMTLLELPVGDGDGAKLINGNGHLIEESPTALAIRAFKQSQRQGAAA